MKIFGSREDSGETGENQIPGDRGPATVNQAASIESRVSTVLATGLMTALGLGMLTWYYAHAMTRQTSARANDQTASAARAQGELPLPSLGQIYPPAPGREPAFSAAEIPLTQARPAYGTPLLDEPSAYTGTAEYGGPSAGMVASPEKTRAQLASERRLSGSAFISATAPVGVAPTLALARAAVATAADSGDGDLAALSRATVTPSVAASLLPTRRFLLPKGAFVDCTLETAIDSTLPGMTTCVTATDTFSADGEVVLLERGSKLVGETRGQVQQGAARVFVLWTEARTPNGVVIPLASPGTDELGRSGLAGTVERHFWERFGAAILISTLNGAVQAAVQSSARSSGGGAVIYNPSGAQDIMTEILKSTVNIPPTIAKQPGERIQILVARDLDFRAVYALRSVESAR